MNPRASGETLVVRRIIQARRERVFAAWLDPASLAQWMRPSGITDAKVEVDAKVGGRFRIVMIEEPKRYEHTGEYLVTKPPERLEFTWISEATDHRPTVVTIEFLERDRETELVLTHRRLPASQVGSHRAGWTDIMQKLELLSGNGP
ncbi:MAG: SRPBCC domain-containing protein [Gemmatimonadales bacterium]